MNLTTFKNNFKAHPLLHTVALSIVLHMMAFTLFPLGDSQPNSDREKPIKVKFIQEKELTPEKTLPKLSENKITPKPVDPKKSPDKIRPNPVPKSAIITNAKVSPTPPHSVIKNLVPIHNSQQIFKPVNAVQKHASFSQPVSEYKQATPIQSFETNQPSARIIQETQLKQITPVPLTQLAVATDVVKSIQNESFRPVLIKSSVSTKSASLNSNIQTRSFNEVKYESSQIPTALDSTQLISENISTLKTAKIQQPSPINSNEKKITSQPAVGIKSVGIAELPSPSNTLMARKPQVLDAMEPVTRVQKDIFKPLTQPGQTVSTQTRVSQRLDSELVSQYQPAFPVSANHFSFPLSRLSLVKEALIPPGFSDETPKRDEEVTNSPLEKVARLSDGVSQLPSDLLNQIRNGFSAMIRNRIAQVKYYPRIARKRGFEGQPVVAFTLGNGGELLELSIVTPSPFKLLDKAALDAVKSASPYPQIPELLKINSIKFNLPISFMLEER